MLWMLCWDAVIVLMININKDVRHEVTLVPSNSLHSPHFTYYIATISIAPSLFYQYRSFLVHVTVWISQALRQGWMPPST